jgi:hypothetical protein
MLPQAGRRDGVTRMMETLQPQARPLLVREADAGELVAESHLIIHPAEGGQRIGGTGRTDWLAHQIQIEHERQTAAQDFLHRLSDEGPTELFDRVLHGLHRLGITGCERAADAAVVGPVGLVPGACHGRIVG